MAEHYKVEKRILLLFLADVSLYDPKREIPESLNKIVDELEKPIVEQMYFFILYRKDNWSFFELAFFPNPKLVGPRRIWKINDKKRESMKTPLLKPNGVLSTEYFVSLLCSQILPFPFSEENIEFVINRLGRYMDKNGEGINNIINRKYIIIFNFFILFWSTTTKFRTKSKNNR